MNAVVNFTPNKLPAHLRNAEVSEITKALAGGGAGGGKRVSIKGGVFRLIVDGKEVGKVDERHLDVVVVAAAPKVSRQYYATQFDEEAAPTAPDCWSPDGETPDASSKDRQSDRCITCPMNAKGSGKGDSRACRFQQRVAVVLANDMEGDVLQLQLPATSLFGKEDGDNRPLQAYARWLSAQGIGIDALVTQMRFDTDAANPKLFFKPVRWLEEAEYATCQAQGKTEDAKRAIAYTPGAIDSGAAVEKALGAKPAHVKADVEAPAPAAKKPAPAAKKPAPKVEVEEVEVEEVEVEAPKPAVRAKPAAPAPKSLADIVDEWDDED